MSTVSEIEKAIIEARDDVEIIKAAKERGNWEEFYIARLKLLAIFHELSGCDFDELPPTKKDKLFKEYKELEIWLKEYFTTVQSTRKPGLYQFINPEN